MSDRKIDTRGSGKFAQALLDGANRFCNAHPNEVWEISGVTVQDGLSLNATDGKRHLTAKILLPVIDMADSIFLELEKFRNAN